MKQNCRPTRQFQNLLSKFTSFQLKSRLSNIDHMKIYSRMHGSDVLDHNYQYILQLIEKETVPRLLLKYLYLVHGCLQYHNYEPRLLEQFQDISFPQLATSDQMEEWLQQVCHHYFKYLVKVCLNQQLYCNLSVGKVNPETAIIDTFLIINLFNVYLAHAKQAFNVSGRYYLKTLFEFQDMYDIIRKEFENMYEYMKVLVNRVTGSYQLYSHQEIMCFLEAMVEVDIVNDFFQEFVKNKYYSTYQSIQLITWSPSEQDNIVQYVLYH